MLLLLVVVILTVVDAHPQCLDSRAPFEPGGTFPICRIYEKFGCCGPAKVWQIHEEYVSILESAESFNLRTECRDYIENILCQKCSPYAAHLYDVERPSAPQTPTKVFPGLCLNYCQDLFQTCDPLLHLFIKTNISPNLTNVKAFCNDVKSADMDYCFPDLLENSKLQGKITQTQVTREDCLCMEEFEAGPVEVPLIFRHAGDGTKRIFIGERSGLIYVYLANGRRLETPFLNLSSSVLTTDSPGEERGLLGLAFHPNFAENRRFFVHYSMSLGKSEFVKVSEFLVSENDDNLADHTSERTLLVVRQPYWNHNGGELLFGDDGYLFVTFGDGGSAGDPHGFAQNRNSLLGKMLRIDVDTRTEDLPYGIPDDNPFNASDGRREVWAYGLRNVWRCGLDKGDEDGKNRGRIICGDVGQSRYEEIDIIQRGGNYGWNAREGVACYKADICGNIGEEIFPIHSYEHSEGKSVIGGHVYRGCLNPNLRGLYIYGDHHNGRLFRLKEEFPGAWSSASVTMCGNDICMNGLVGQYPPNINTFGEDEYGELYMVSFQRSLMPVSQHTGKVYRLVDPRRRGNPETCVPARTTLANLRKTAATANFYQRPNTTYPPRTPVGKKTARGNQASGAMATTDRNAAIMVTMATVLLHLLNGTGHWVT